MPRNPIWTDAAAAEFAARIASDDGQSRPVVIGDLTPNPEPNGNLTAGSDAIDFVTLELDRDTVYTVLGLGGEQPVAVSIFDDEGYLLAFVDGGSFGIPETEEVEVGGEPVTLFFDTIYQFRPDASGTHHVAIQFEDPDASGAYQVSVRAETGAPGSDGNTGPVAVDQGLAAVRFAATLLDPLGNDFDADGDPLGVEAIALQPAAGVAFVVDGEVLYRSAPGFTGRDTFDVRIGDGRGGTDVQRIFVEVEAPPPGPEASVADAQLVAYLYEAGLDRDGNIDLPGLNFWIGVLEEGTPLRAIAGAFLRSNEFTEAFGAIDTLGDAALVRELYRNVLDREGEQAGVDFWTGQLARPEVTREDMLIAFAESTENMIGSPATATLVDTADGDWVFG